ncbi:hypothetical protein I6N90_07770 [Paenibacillus sp. GSMTC-2017]|nr:hypothetical protein [Paenibacillus sp. GSMTC-2017]MBH5317698.1 hypothetical protein [Paenibacillus sp. GSMTC-2017]
MGRHKHQTSAGKNHAYATNSKIAENNVAASTSEHRNQKGHIPNSPSTG